MCKYIVTLKEAIQTSKGLVTTLEADNAVSDAISPTGCLEVWAEKNTKFLIPVHNVKGVVRIDESTKADEAAQPEKESLKEPWKVVETVGELNWQRIGQPEELSDLQIRLRCVEAASQMDGRTSPIMSLVNDFYNFITKEAKG